MFKNKNKHYNMSREMLSRNIRELRIERGLTQTELAKAIGVTQGAVYFWEKGINEPTAGYLVKMATLFSVSVDELLSFDGQKPLSVDAETTEMTRLFSRLTKEQRQIMISVAKEILKN